MNSADWIIDGTEKDGLTRIVLYDDRENSGTRGEVNKFGLGTVSPVLVIVPDRVWHGVPNICENRSSILNVVDAAYEYEDPDIRRLPLDTQRIPCSFLSRVASRATCSPRVSVCAHEKMCPK